MINTDNNYDLTNRISEMLNRRYNIPDASLSETRAGWSALAYKVTSGDKNYFLKVYDKHRYTSQSWIKGIDDYMPVLLWLEKNTGLHGRIPSTVLTADGNYKCEDEDYIYLLFDFIEGVTLCTKTLDKTQIRELAGIIAELHNNGDKAPVPLKNLYETFDVSFCGNFLNDLRSDKTKRSADLYKVLSPYNEIIFNKIQELKELAENLRTCKPQFVLCHTDIHGWNVMQAESLKLIDWEGLKQAPPEADLFSFSKDFFFDYAWDDFMSAYGKFRSDYRENPIAMRFYRLRRRLEDAAAFTEGLLYDNLNEKDREQSLKLLEHECLMLSDV
jgi:thiamine kinase-like enzyme